MYPSNQLGCGSQDSAVDVAATSRAANFGIRIPKEKRPSRWEPGPSPAGKATPSSAKVANEYSYIQ